MKRKRIPITPEMIRECFGPDAAITKRLGWFKVRTRDGGEMKINNRHINPVHLSRCALAGATRLAGEAWGGGTINGSADFKMAVLAHGEAEGVGNLKVAERGRWARMIVPGLIAWGGVAWCDVGPAMFFWLFVAGLVWLLMRRAAKLEAQRETEQLGFPFPNTGGDAREAGDEDLREGEWL